jgi:hypothetical protein
MRLLLKYNELAKLHNIPPETPINFGNVNNINDELLMAIILRLRRAIKRLEHLPLEEEEEEEETPEPEPEPEDLTWYAIKTSDPKPTVMDGFQPYKGFILDGWFYCPSPTQNNKLLCIPITYLSAYTDNERYKSLPNNTKPYYNVIFSDNTSMAVLARGTTVSKITSEDVFNGITFQNNPPMLTVTETIKNKPAET